MRPTPHGRKNGGVNVQGANDEGFFYLEHFCLFIGTTILFNLIHLCTVEGLEPFSLRVSKLFLEQNGKRKLKKIKQQNRYSTIE
jgi:hypothetical protein